MKKYILLSLKCLLLLALILGCSVLQINREVRENTFVSSYPNLAIKVSPEYKYIGNIDDKSTGQSISGRDLRYRDDSYSFVKPDKDQAGKVVSIQIETVETYFVSDFFRNIENPLSKGTTDIGGEKFQYYTRLVKPTMDRDMTRHIAGQGYKMPVGLEKVFGRIYGAKGNTLVKIYYYEALDNSEFGGRSWNNADDLSPKQIECLRDFNESAKLAFELRS